MSLDLTDVRAKLNNVKRGLKFEEDVVANFYNVSTLILALSEDWHMRSLNVRTVANEPLYEMSVADVEDEMDLNNTLPLVTAVGIDGLKYKIVQYDQPEGATKVWKMRLAPTGETE